MIAPVVNVSLPRTLPGKLKAAVFFGQVQFLIGFCFSLIGGIMLGIFVPQTDFSSFSFKGNEPVATGVITDVQQMSIRENRHYIYEYAFRFTAADGKTYSDASYDFYIERLAPGDSVKVEYLADQPSKARITGMRTAPFGLWQLIFLLFPLIGLVMLVVGARKAKRTLYLLTNGLLVYGEVTGKERTRTKINNRYVYKIFFRFQVNGTEYTAEGRTHRPERVFDEKREPLVYDPERPGNAVLLDTQPRAVRRFFNP